MKHLIIFSGSPASAVCAKMVSDKIDGKHDTIELVYCQTYSEHIDTLRFIRQVSVYLGIPIRPLSSGKDLFSVIEDEGRFPQGKENFCSKILKHDVLDKFLKDNMDNEIYFPYTASETFSAQKTAARLTKNSYLTPSVNFPLIERNVSKERCADIVENEWKIKLPVMYNLFNEITCFPCVNKTSANYWVTIFKEYPHMFNKMMDMERDMKQTIMPDISLETLKKSIRLGRKITEGAQGNLPCDCGK